MKSDRIICDCPGCRRNPVKRAGIAVLDVADGFGRFMAHPVADACAILLLIFGAVCTGILYWTPTDHAQVERWAPVSPPPRAATNLPLPVVSQPLPEATARVSGSTGER